jgi:hypothetical protein
MLIPLSTIFGVKNGKDESVTIPTTTKNIATFPVPFMMVYPLGYYKKRIRKRRRDLRRRNN